MRVGTNSLLFGAHCFLLHPVAVFVAWRRLYGFPWDPRLWASFIVHDWGYWRKESMDRPQSEEHVELGGRIMDLIGGARWGDLVRRHSRQWCQLHGKPYSRLCVADKLAFALTPAWLYLPTAKAAGELAEYMAVADARQCGEKFTGIERGFLESADPRVWLEGLKRYSAQWIEQHQNPQWDTWSVPRGILKKLRSQVLVRESRKRGLSRGFVKALATAQATEERARTELACEL